MYRDHQPRIARLAQTADGLARVLQFAALSAHTPFDRAVSAMQGILDGHDEFDRGALYGHKHTALAGLWEQRGAIAWNLRDLFDGAPSRREAADDALAYLAGLPGLGFAKGGFALQMALGVSGCLDAHNLRDHGISPYVARGRLGERPVRLRTLRRRVALYNATVRRLGGTAALWDSWCAGMTRRYPDTYRNADHVSALHCEALGI